MTGNNRSVVVAMILVAAAALFHPADTAAQSPDLRTENGTVSGVIRDTRTEAPIGSARVSISGTDATVLSGADGGFRLSEIPAGTHTLGIMRLGYEEHVEEVRVVAGAMTVVDVRLSPVAISLDEIVVTPGRFGVMRDNAAAPQTMGREMIETMPGLGEDIYRMVHRLPGVAADDYSARFAVRGGGHDEILVRLDGLTLFEPFHLKDLDGALSIVDVQAVRGVDLTTGGFTAEYGNRLTGVFDMRTRREMSPGTQTSAGISLTNARFMSTGVFSNNRGNWLVSARRGYLDLLLKLIDPEEPFSPKYHDIIAKVEYELSPRHIVSVNFLTAGDAMTVSDDHFDLDSRYGNHYAWLNWRAYPGNRLSIETVFSGGRLNWMRNVHGGAAGTEITELRLEDDRDFLFGGIQQDWTWRVSEGHLLKWGGGVRSSRAGYDYLRFQDGEASKGRPLSPVDMEADVTASGVEAGGYLAHRTRVASFLTTELGIRYDHYSQSGESVASPRMNAALALGDRTTVRGAWGLYHQPQEVYQLHVQDGDADFYRAERAEHRVIGIDHTLDSGVDLRAEVYQRVLTRVRPRYHNLFNVNSGFEEAAPDRIRLEPSEGEARGIELLASSDPRNDLRWSISYALASVEDIIDDRTVPRGVDQRHSALLELGYRPSARWSLASSWQIRSGRPYTNSTIASTTLPDGTVEHRYVFGAPYGERLDSYHRMDVRVTRRFQIGRSELDVFVDVFNLYGRENPRGWSTVLENDGSGGVYLEEGPVMNLPRLPSIGVSWRF